LHRTLEQLLLLARVEGSLSCDDGVQCNAEQVARLAIQDATGGVPRRIKLQVSPQLTDAPVQMPAVLSIAALRNLLENAVRHTPDDTEIELNVEMIGQRVRFQVRDHGPGIAADDIQHLTQRFWRNGQSNGCGLGLAIVQAIVQRCGCGLQFDSRPDGLRVELTVPVQLSPGP
jgi:signal transduction histidine kinase